ncbi:3-hydroxyacyl-CoA dehydrogenase [Streptomyces albireticuli]|uniref:3-hydroxyacyl-CoA dehydrogenase n=1 Tax=Streptomyces albireticuli TaxID=1940 RepID=A0A2A2CZX2_9ACTN|nr:3-hydroxyacyl-CoA dehydrogenase [Streptomyces albireticuli]MCD9143828.1 3-hydroxyacyl-CoA dehydrogenase [Streptomyces albireticuli]MCD9161741.1 3-hydroxyacyl-CoA dehydrogenase [Streptomyces albireticuli]MCD9191945.1 3-hydroxyacyl-CoA dehydrogenase [Streptomyces albireticuli]PAU44716.1 3-hydroxyacyl-CoA dehydrogenase [Streptomyces albireticuli]
MTAIELGRTVAVVGTGTMGQGIAQVALVAGHPVRLYDAAEGRAAEAARAIGARLDRLVEKGRLDAAGRDAARARLHPATSTAELADSALVIEAILEQLDAKQKLFVELESVVPDDCLLATNTSSLSVTAVAGALRLPGRFVGLHFFNPAPLLPLVEVVQGHATDPAAADRAQATVAAWGKTPVRSADTPGFIVNRVARPFYAEAFRLLEERVADPATLDAVLRESGGFAMGPFELTDLIGQDVNEAVTRSVYDSFFQDPKFRPSLAQRRLVEAGLLGRKSGRGWYDYADGAERPVPRTEEPAPPPGEVAVHAKPAGPAAVLREMIEEAGIKVTRDRTPGMSEGFIRLPGGACLALTDGYPATTYPDEPFIRFDLALDYRAATRIALAPSHRITPEQTREAVGLFQALGKRVSVVADVPGMIVARTVAMIVDFAVDAAARGVASPEDIDTAMRLGVNYPGGPFEWTERLGAHWLWDLLDTMHHQSPGGRYAPSWALRRRADIERQVL